MSWPIGYGNPSLRYVGKDNGPIEVNGVKVTDVSRWIDVQMPSSAILKGAPCILTLRLEVAPDRDGHACLAIGEVVAAGRRFEGFLALVTAGAAAWAHEIVPALHHEVSRRLAAGMRPTTPMRAVRVEQQPRIAPDRLEVLP